jgi:hypothetical protein
MCNEVEARGMGHSPMVSRCPSGHQRSGCPPGRGVLAGADLCGPSGWLRALKAGCLLGARLIGLWSPARACLLGRDAGAFGRPSGRKALRRPGDPAVRPPWRAGAEGPRPRFIKGTLDDNAQRSVGTEAVSEWHHGSAHPYSRPLARRGGGICPVCGHLVERAAPGGSEGLPGWSPSHAELRRAVGSDRACGVGWRDAIKAGNRQCGRGDQGSEEPSGALPVRLTATVAALPRQGGEAGGLSGLPCRVQGGDPGLVAQPLIP